MLEWLFGGGKPSPEKFARLMTDALRAAGEKGAIDFDAAGFKLTLGTGQFFLHNAFEEYCAAGRAQRSAVLARFARTFAERSEFPASFDDAAEHLLPRVRERPYYDFTRLQLELQGLKPPDARPHQLLGDHLAESIVYDLPSSIAEVSPATLESWGTAFYLARERALENLEARSQEPFETIAPGVFVSPWHDNHDPARLLLVEKLRELAVGGDPVVVPVHRDLLVVAGSDDETALDVLAKVVESQRQAPRLMTLVPLRLAGEDWETWTPPGASEAARRLRRLRVESELRDHAEQKSLLDRLHEQQERDLFVASLTGLEPKDGGEPWTYCVWGEGVVALLPRADFVVFLREPERKAEPLRVAWARVREIMGAALDAVPELYPERWLVTGFPAEDELVQLRAAAVPFQA